MKVDTLSTNRKIAKYIGYTYYLVGHHENDDIPPRYQCGWKLHNDVEPNGSYENGVIGKRVWLSNNHYSLQFHKNFEWLWAFFKKLEENGYIFNISNNYCSIQESKKHNIIIQQRANSTFDACYLASEKFLRGD